MSPLWGTDIVSVGAAHGHCEAGQCRPHEGRLTPLGDGAVSARASKFKCFPALFSLANAGSPEEKAKLFQNLIGNFCERTGGNAVGCTRLPESVSSRCQCKNSWVRGCRRSDGLSWVYAGGTCVRDVGL